MAKNKKRRQESKEKAEPCAEGKKSETKWQIMISLDITQL